MYTIENDHLRVRVRTKGAELTSIFDKTNNIEHLWQADPAVWGWHAPVLFPVVGRCLNDIITVDGKEYKMEKHGFARNMNFELAEQTKESLTFRLSSDKKTLELYPYQFDLYISYELKGKNLLQTYEVENKGKDKMFFQLGGHPAFTVPFLAGERYEDYYLEFDKDKVLDRENINEDGYFDTSISGVINGTNQLQLESDMFARDAIILKEISSRKVIIKSNKNPHTLAVAFHNFYYLGLWAKVDAPYLCIEPWRGCADTVGHPVPYDQKEGVVSLPSLGEFHASITITVS